MSERSPLQVFTAKACAGPLEEVARKFEQETGQPVKILVCTRTCAGPLSKEGEKTLGQAQDFIIEIAEIKGLDVAISGAEYLLDDADDMGLIDPSSRCTCGLRVSAILVPPGNPKAIHSLEDLTKPGVRIGISVIDCLKGLWEDICARAGIINEVRSNITLHANGCIAITEAVSEGKVDAGFGWTTFRKLSGNTLGIIDISPEYRLYRGTCAALMKGAQNPDMGHRFLKFLSSEVGHQIYKRHGWLQSPNEQKNQ